MAFRKRLYIKPKSIKIHEKSQSTKLLGFIYKRFLNAIFVFQNVKKYKGILDFLETENRVQKTFVYAAQSHRKSWKSQSDNLLSAVPATRLNARFHFQECELVPRESYEWEKIQARQTISEM